MDTLRTECEKIMFNTCDKYASGSSVIVPLACLGQQTYSQAKIIFIKCIGKYYIILYIFITLVELKF